MKSREFDLKESKIEELSNILLEKYDNNINSISSQLSHKAVNEIISDISKKEHFIKKKININRKPKNSDFSEEKGAKNYLEKFFEKSEIFNFKKNQFKKENLQFLKSASIINNQIILNSTNKYSRGAVWYKQKLFLQEGFSSHFRFRINDKGGDGFAFVLHDDPFSMMAIGRKCSSIGYGGLRKCVAIEFDTTKNVFAKDENDNHIALMTGDTGKCYANHQISEIKCYSNLDFRLNDAKDHNVQIYYDGENSMLDVFVDEKFLFTCRINLRSVFDKECWIGFTSNGNTNQGHIISGWSLYSYQNREIQENEFEKNYLEKESLFESDNKLTETEESNFNPFVQISFLEKELEKRIEESHDFVEKEILSTSLQNLEEILISLHKMGIIVYFRDSLINDFLISHPTWLNNCNFFYK